MALKQQPIAKILCVTENCLHTMSSHGFSTLRGAFISAKVIRIDQGDAFIRRRRSVIQFFRIRYSLTSDGRCNERWQSTDLPVVSEERRDIQLIRPTLRSNGGLYGPPLGNTLGNS